MLSLEVWTALCLSIPVFGRRLRRGTADVFFEQSTIQQKDGILTFSHHPNSHPINSRMANKCGMMGCHSDHSSSVQVKVNPWFAISLCLYELTRQLD